jgi:methylated-DNA-[protein]-cysteine S-methyltransferase
MNKMRELQRLLLKIPKGKITSYKIISVKMKIHPRVGGKLLSRNDSEAPCYKVVCSDGRIGGYSGRGGIKEKIRKLRLDGIIVKNRKIMNFKKYIYYFS